MAETTSQPQSRTSGLTTVYRVLAIVTTVAIVLQFFLAGFGAFHDYRSGETNDFAAHEKVGYVIAILSLLMIVAAALARLGGRAVGMVTGLFVLAGPVQVLLAHLGTGHSEVWGALHATVGALILGFMFTLLRLHRAT
jgi:uncharacterized protein DUF6220